MCYAGYQCLSIVFAQCFSLPAPESESAGSLTSNTISIEFYYFG
jgi:hypothetical protein